MISDASSGSRVPRTRLLSVALLAAAAALVALSGALPPEAQLALRYDRAGLARGEWWRLATAHAAHLGAGHALANAAALLLIVWLGRAVRGAGEWLWLALVSGLAIDAGLLWLYPRVDWYLGASGVLHGLFGGAALLTTARDGRARGLVMLALLFAKLVLDWHGASLLHAAGPGFPVLEEAHWLGAAGGLAAGLALLALRRRL